MTAPIIRPELREWILATHRAGHSVEVLLRMMQETGYDPRQSKSIVAAVLNMPLDAVDIHTPPAPLRTRHPEPPLVRVGGQEIAVTLRTEQPVVRVLHGLLSSDECLELIEQARPRLDRAKTVDQQGKHQVDTRRTSAGMFFRIGETPLIQRIEQRISELLDIPVDHGEGLQILNYQPGQQYEEHFDWFDPAQPGFAAVTARGGQRIASLVIYLNTPSKGGATAFPEIGLQVTALRGSAVYFAYETNDRSSLHAGLPVEAGEKWIATKWLRERPFQPR